MKEYIYYLTCTGKWGCIRSDELSKIVPTRTDGKSVVSIQKTDGTVLDGISSIDFNKNKRGLVEKIDEINYLGEKFPVYQVTVCPNTSYQKNITVFTCDVLPTEENAKYSYLLKTKNCAFFDEEDFINNTEEVISNAVAIQTVLPDFAFDLGENRVYVFVGTEHQRSFHFIPLRDVYKGCKVTEDTLIVPNKVYDKYVEKKTENSKHQILRLASERALQIN